MSRSLQQIIGTWAAR